jgi:hypothetical protein
MFEEIMIAAVPDFTHSQLDQIFHQIDKHNRGYVTFGESLQPLIDFILD